MVAAMAEARMDLLVLYTTRVDACVGFYAGLGLEFVRERHGDGPEHHAARLAGGGVLEIYPAAPGRVTGAVRLGFTVRGSTLPPGRSLLRDPDDRVVEVVSVSA